MAARWAVLPSGATLLSPEDAVLVAMFQGWERQQRGAPPLQEKTIADRAAVVRGSWRSRTSIRGKEPQPVDQWMSHQVSESGLAVSTLRHHQGSLRLFGDYVTSPYYDWPKICEERFGSHLSQVCRE